MTCHRARLVLGLSLLTFAAAGTFLPSCDTVPAVSEAVSRTSTITLSRESSVVFITDVAVELTGTLIGSNVTVDFSGTVTASSADQAKAAAAAVTIIHVSDAETLRVELRRPEGSQSMAGLAKVTLPRGMNVGITSGGGVHVRSIDRAIVVESNGDVIAEEIRDSARIIAGGAILLSSTVPSSSTLEAQAGGSMELALPAAISAEIDLSVPEGAQISIQHPGLPAPVSPGSSGYQTVVRGGAAVVRAVSLGGNITIVAL
jgi:hypothetical protein